MKKSVSHRVREVEREIVYEVRGTRMHSTYQWHKPTRMVFFDRFNAKVDCECKGFLYQGVLCSHALAVMRHVGLESYLPSFYILKRWTHDANANTKRGINDREIEDNPLHSVKRNALTKRMESIVNMALHVSTAYDMTCRALDELDEVLKMHIIDQNVNGRLVEHNTRDALNTDDSLKFSDLPLSQYNGKRKPNRFKAPADVRDAKKMMTCSYCHKKAGHNSRSCPERIRDEMARKGKGLETVSKVDDYEVKSDEDEDEDEEVNNFEFESEEDLF